MSGISFLSPGRLWLFVVVLGLAGLYVWLQQRRRHRAVRYTNIDLLRSVAPRRPGWRRHVPALATALALASLVVAFARPAQLTRIPKEAATVILVLDVSASMQATDVAPTRVEAAVSAANTFVQTLPPQLKVGLVTFDRQARVITSPTTDHAQVLRGLDQVALGSGTAAGEAIYAALDAVAAANAANPGTTAGGDGAAIVLLSDGVTTVGRDVLGAARLAADKKVPVSTIAFGTANGSVFVQGRMIPVPADPDTMARVAEITSGKFFEAFSAKELRSVYQDIGTRVGFETEQREVSAPVLTASALLLAVGLALSLFWNGRLV
jgi:Ca-activated chloride channel family protein